MSVYQELYHTLEEQAVINTHCHNHIDVQASQWSLAQLLAKTYCNCNYPVQNIQKDPADFFERMSCNSYAYWLFQAYGKLYGQSSPLSIENYPQVAEFIRQLYQKEGSDQYDILINQCKYRAILLDDHICPGNNHQNKLMRPAIRCDMYLHGYEKRGTDQHGNCPYDYITGDFPSSFSQYRVKMQQAIQERKQQMDCHAIKIAIAYERDLHFSCFDETMAEKALQGMKSPENIRAFQDCTMDALCQISVDLDLPIQIHTGLGCLEKTRALELLPLIQRHPNTKFVLLHGSYPWLADAVALANNFSNVYPDLSWIPLLSTEAAEHFLKQLLDTTDSHRLAWGCDTWTSQESFGALLALRHVAAKVLSRRVEDGLYTLSYATYLGKRLLWDNPKALYQFHDLT